MQLFDFSLSVSGPANGTRSYLFAISFDMLVSLLK